ncbi:hypothetical protein BJF79_33680 [Actinomadura sp. CNU-125]|nr:hypothetical protein BJF79_33680 [Actinomadura sp. CNU-125]
MLGREPLVPREQRGAPHPPAVRFHRADAPVPDRLQPVLQQLVGERVPHGEGLVHRLDGRVRAPRAEPPPDLRDGLAVHQ